MAKITLKSLTISILVTILLGCASVRYHSKPLFYADSDLTLQEHEMFSKLRNTEEKAISRGFKGVEKMHIADMIYMPEEPSLIDEKLVSVNVTEEIPVIDVIIEISRMAGVDVQIDPTIAGGIILNIKDKPLKYVFNRICGMTDTRYKEKNGIIIFEKDMPSIKSYYLDFLDAARTSSGSMSLNTSVISQNGGGSSSSVSTNSEDKLWDDIQTDIKQLIETTEKTYKYYSKSAEKAQEKQDASLNLNAVAKATLDVASDANNQYKPNNENSTNTTNSKDNEVTGGAMNVNKRAGIITITASEKSHRKIQKYLTDIKRKITAQVLIEMKFVEVTLSKQYAAGIDWNNVNFGSVASVSMSKAASVAAGGVSPAVALTLTPNGSKSSDLNGLLNLLENFGSVRVLSNPRINAVNNQPALLTIATNQVYFKTQTTIIPATTSGTNIVTPAIQNITATPQTIPVGIVMSVLPSINLDKRAIILNVKPTISKLENTVSDPSVDIANSNTNSTSTTKASNSIPITSIRELDTILQLEDGQMSVLGGFTERRNAVIEEKIPILGDLWLIGNLFKYKSETTSFTETLILLKASIVDGTNNKMTNFDKKIYHEFSDDPRDLENI